MKGELQMKIYDISSPIFEGMPVYKNKPEKQPKIKSVTNAHVTESRLELDVHSGTHIDAPLHMVNDGETFETIPLEFIWNPTMAFWFVHVEDGITREDLEKFNLQEQDFILFKTKNSLDEDFNPEFIYLKESGANYLAELKIRGVGIDALGVERS